MSRQPATTALPWLLRWLLILATLAGSGIWQGGHCTDDMSADLRLQRDSVSTSSVSHGPVTEPTATILHSDAEGPRLSRHDGPNTTARTCRDLSATVSCSAVTAALLQPDGVRTAVAIPRIAPAKDRVRPVVTLVRIGVSRT